MGTRQIERPLTSSVTQLWERLADPAVSERRARVDGADGEVFTHELDGDDLVIGIATGIPESWMPAAVRSRLGRGGMPGLPTVRRTERWRRAAETLTGTMDLDIGGVPATAGGRMGLADDGAGSSVGFYEIELSVSVPLVGRGIEQAVLARIAGVLDRELDILDGRG